MAEYKNINLVSRNKIGYITIATQNNRLGRGTGITRRLRLKKLLDKFYKK